MCVTDFENMILRKTPLKFWTNFANFGRIKGQTTVTVRNVRVFSGIYFNQTTQVNQCIA